MYSICLVFLLSACSLINGRKIEAKVPGKFNNRTIDDMIDALTTEMLNDDIHNMLFKSHRCGRMYGTCKKVAMLVNETEEKAINVCVSPAKCIQLWTTNQTKNLKDAIAKAFKILLADVAIEDKRKVIAEQLAKHPNASLGGMGENTKKAVDDMAEKLVGNALDEANSKTKHVTKMPDKKTMPIEKKKQTKKIEAPPPPITVRAPPPKSPSELPKGGPVAPVTTKGLPSGKTNKTNVGKKKKKRKRTHGGFKKHAIPHPPKKTIVKATTTTALASTTKMMIQPTTKPAVEKPAPKIKPKVDTNIAGGAKEDKLNVMIVKSDNTHIHN